MPLTSVAVRASIRWAMAAARTGTNDATQEDSLTSRPTIDTGTYNHVFFAEYTIAAAGTQVVDFYGPWTSILNESVTATKILTFLVVVSGNSSLTVEPDATDGLDWPMGTGPYTITAVTNTDAHWEHFDGTHKVIDNTHKEWLLTNTGANSLNVTIVAIAGT